MVFGFLLASTGIIQPYSRLDYEDASRRHFLLNVSATDQGTPQLSAYVTVAINIVDYNDNSPVFNDSSLVAQVRENLEPGAFVARLLATDLDSDDNALVSKLRNVFPKLCILDMNEACVCIFWKQMLIFSA